QSREFRPERLTLWGVERAFGDEESLFGLAEPYLQFAGHRRPTFRRLQRRRARGRPRLGFAAGRPWRGGRLHFRAARFAALGSRRSGSLPVARRTFRRHEFLVADER